MCIRDSAWVQGFALVGRYRDLHAEDDWRAANTILERAADHGSHRAEAAFLLVALQDLGNHRDDPRQLKYARLLQQLEPESPNLCLLYTSDAADERSSVDLGGRRII